MKLQSVLVPTHADCITLVVCLNYSNVCQNWHGTSDSLEQLFSQENVPLNMQKLNNTIIGYKNVTKLSTKYSRQILCQWILF